MHDRQAFRHNDAMRWLWRVVFAVSLGTVLRASDTVALAGRAMGTTWQAKFVQPARPLAKDAVQARISARLQQLEQIFSTYRPDSELSRFNASVSSEWQPVSAELARVASESRRISELTAGAFDATVAPLVLLWGFGAQRREGGLPRDDEIAAARARVSWRDLEVRIDQAALRKKRPEIAADFSSLAKGFASDEIAALLDGLGASDHFVQVGGDIRAGGRNGAEAWRAGIEEPEPEARGIAAAVNLSNRALSTSGNYRNAFVVAGRRYGHVIDPRTGWPVNASPANLPRSADALAAVSVVHASCAQSSAWATALFVLGADDGWRIASQQSLACLFFVRENGGVVRKPTPEFARLMR